MLDNSQKEILININDELIENDNNNKDDINELIKFFPDFKECTLSQWVEEKGPVCVLNEKEKSKSLLEPLGIFAGFSIFFLPIVACICIQTSLWILFPIIYILFVILQFFSPQIKDYYNSRDNKTKFFKEFEKNIIEMVKTNIYFIKDNENEGYFEFVIKNSIDISGEIDMTKPPKFYYEENNYNERKKIINSGQQKLNNSVFIITCYPRIYTIDKQTNKKLELYIENYGFIRKNPAINYNVHFYRNFKYIDLICIPFLFSSFYFKYYGSDVYYIEPRKIISCEDLDNNYNLSICSNLKPKYTFYTGEEIIFKEGCIINKADEEKVKIFNENYFSKLGQEEGYRDKLNKLGIFPNKSLYSEVLGNLYISVFITKYYTIECNLKYDLKGVEYSYTVGRNRAIITDDVHLECKKEGLEKKGDLNYLYIKYLEKPFIIGNYNALTFEILYKKTKLIFGPEIIYV